MQPSPEGRRRGRRERQGRKCVRSTCGGYYATPAIGKSGGRSHLRSGPRSLTVAPGYLTPVGPDEFGLYDYVPFHGSEQTGLIEPRQYIQLRVERIELEMIMV